jgi:hypothetical protein
LLVGFVEATRFSGGQPFAFGDQKGEINLLDVP